jgi:hypothetical protein
MTARASVSLAAAALLLSACGRDEVTSYRVPKEADPVMPGAAPAADASSAPLAPMAADAGGAPGMGAAGAGATMANTAVPTANGPSLVWSAPAAWRTKSGSAMRKGSYAVPGPGGAEADLSITAFPGDVGGDLANVNRWRGQVQLPPLGPAELEGAVARFQSNGLAVTVVDLTGAGAANRQSILGAIVPVSGSTWFFKLMGPTAVVAAAKPAFLEFLRSVKAP